MKSHPNQNFYLILEGEVMAADSHPESFIQIFEKKT